MGAVNQAWPPKDVADHYYKVQGLDGWWMIVKGYPSGPSIKGGLTREEADAYLKLLKED